MSKTVKLVEAELSATGLPYRIEPSKKHHKVYLNGAMVGVISKGTGGENAPGIRNLCATIRRAAKGAACQSSQKVRSAA
jgi:hypothetical protein